MYRQYFNLQRDPFGMTPDAGIMQMTVAQREALAGMLYAVLGRRGFVALIGAAGTGKTTLLNKLMGALKGTRARFSVILNPLLSPAEFLESALIDFGIDSVPASKAQRLLLLQRLLLEPAERGSTSVLIVDEAHKLSAEVLEEIRLLGNIERPEGKLLQIVMAGQPELAGLLDRHDLQQLKQRVAIRLQIGPLTPAEVQAYIAHRWRAAGGLEHPFDPEALTVIARCSKGIPRVTNALCDNALVLAMSAGVKTVTREQAEEAARDLAFTESAPGPVPDAARSTEPPAAVAAIEIPTLDRYAANSRTSTLSRLLGRLGWAN